MSYTHDEHHVIDKPIFVLFYSDTKNAKVVRTSLIWVCRSRTANNSWRTHAHVNTAIDHKHCRCWDPSTLSSSLATPLGGGLSSWRQWSSAYRCRPVHRVNVYLLCLRKLRLHANKNEVWITSPGVNILCFALKLVGAVLRLGLRLFLVCKNSRPLSAWF